MYQRDEMRRLIVIVENSQNATTLIESKKGALIGSLLGGGIGAAIDPDNSLGLSGLGVIGGAALGSSNLFKKDIKSKEKTTTSSQTFTEKDLSKDYFPEMAQLLLSDLIDQVKHNEAEEVGVTWFSLELEVDVENKRWAGSEIVVISRKLSNMMPLFGPISWDLLKSQSTHDLELKQRLYYNKDNILRLLDKFNQIISTVDKPIDQYGNVLGVERIKRHMVSWQKAPAKYRYRYLKKLLSIYEKKLGLEKNEGS